MLISNFNLCKSEWLELVFEKRNKEYGAYYIRQHYADTVVKAMLIAFATVITATAVTGVLIRVKPATERFIPVTLDQVFKIPTPPKTELPKPKIEQPKVAQQPTAPVNVTRFVPPVVVADPLAEEPPKIAELTGVIGPETIKGAGPGIAPIDAPGKGGEGLGDDMGNAADGKPYIAVENMPVPNGGSTGWAKFLQNTIHYPRQALENEVSGRVIVSFIVEKDGHLSNIHVERGPGYGMDEEAARVLKLAKPWTPGMQNGNPVRVKLTLPVNFTFSE